MKVIPFGRETSLNRRWLLIFLTGFCLGIVFMNFAGLGSISKVGFMSRYMIEQFRYITIDPEKLFFYCLPKRCLPLFYLGVFGLTMFGFFVIGGFILWYGFSLGCLLTMSVIHLGIGGIVLCAASMIPHFLFYFPAFFWGCKGSHKMCAYLYYPHLSTEIIYGKKSRQIFRYILVFLIYLFMVIAGIFLEAYINPLLLKQVIKIF